MAFHQQAESAFQGRDIERAVQCHRDRQVVARGLRIELPEEPHALLGMGQAIAAGHAFAGGNRELGEVHLLAVQGVEEQAAFLGGQLDETAGELPAAW